MNLPPVPAERPPKTKSAQVRLWSLVAVTFFIVSGGAYGTEDIVHGAGYGGAILILILTPLLCSFPTALMVAELSAALPEEGGFYAWVRRGLGAFWGFQEAWLSLAASIFDMAIYPTLFVAYLARLAPWAAQGRRGILMGLAVVAACTALNLAGVRLVCFTSVWLFFLLSAPFVAIVLLAPFHAGALAGSATVPSGSTVGLLGGMLIGMWNYMGWDNASTIAPEVENPQATYPRAMFFAVILVMLSYILPVLAIYITGAPASAFETGAWANLAGLVGGSGLLIAVVLGGMLSGFGMFSTLVMSYSRLPLAMAQDGMLPRVFAKVHGRTKAPWVAILACSAAWALCLGLGFERLVTLDVMFYGAGLLLEFIALVVLRLREPGLPRPFRVPGGVTGAILVGVEPMLLLILSVVRSGREQILGMNGLIFGVLITLAGFALYYATGPLRRRFAQPVTASEPISE